MDPETRKKLMLTQLLRAGGGGLALGVLGRMAVGVPEIFGPTSAAVPETADVPTPVGVPVFEPQPAPLGQEPFSLKQAEKAVSVLRKMANSPSGAAALKSLWDNAKSVLPSASRPRVTPTQSFSLPDLFPDTGASDPRQNPAVLAWGIPLGVGSTLAGWSLADRAIRGHVRGVAERDTEAAKQDLLEEMKQDYQGRLKAAWGQTAVDALNWAATPHAAMFGLSALASGLAAHNYTRSRAPQKVLQRALVERARRRQAPQPVFTYPEQRMLSPEDVESERQQELAALN